MRTPADGRRLGIAAIALLTVGIGTALLLLQRRGPMPGDPSPQADVPAIESRPGSDRASARDERARHGTDTATADREVVALPLPTHEGTWCVQLTGLDPAVPWSSPLVVEFERRYVVEAAVDADGACRFVPPEAVLRPGIQMMRFFADDANYRLLKSHDRTDALQATGRMAVAVLPVAVLRGRVLDPDGDAVAARVRAFAWHGSAPVEPLLGLTTSDAEGHFDLQVPPGIALLIVADVPDNEVMVLGQGYNSPYMVLPERREPDRSPPASELHLYDRGASRPDLLPATTRAAGVLGAPREVPDLRLGRMATLTGRLLLADGRPLPGIDVVAHPRSATAGAFHQGLRWSPTDGVVAGANTRTDTNGNFALWLAPGVPHEVLATSTSPLLLAGEPRATATAPGHVELTAPGDLVRVSVVADGARVQRATIDSGDLPLTADESGELSLTLPPEQVRLRARADVRASAWTELPPGARPDTVTLELLSPELAEVRITVRGVPELQHAEFEWRRGAAPPLRAAASRPDAATPFVLQVPPGSYRLTIRDRPTGIWRAHALLPTQLDLDVPPSGLATSVDAAFGGTILLDVRDANGMHVGGRFTLTDAAGRDVAAPMVTAEADGGEIAMRVAAPGEFSASGPNLLATPIAPGDYTLTIDARGHHRVVRRVTVAAHSGATVQLRLD